MLHPMHQCCLEALPLRCSTLPNACNGACVSSTPGWIDIRLKGPVFVAGLAISAIFAAAARTMPSALRLMRRGTCACTHCE